MGRQIAVDGDFKIVRQTLAPKRLAQPGALDDGVDVGWDSGQPQRYTGGALPFLCRDQHLER